MPERSDGASPRRDSRATAAFVLGLSSLACLGFLTGIPAIVLGAISRKEIDRSRGALTGSRLAAGGIVTGLFGTGLGLILVVALVGSAVETAFPAARFETAGVGSSEAPSVPPGTRSYGPLDVVDLDATGGLAAQLGALATASTGKGRTLLLQTYVRTSSECAEVAAALPDSRMQRALANVTLVRVDVEAFEDELKSMRVDTESVPWFYRLDAKAQPTDALSADAWDANVPENMAPVLGTFARSAHRARSLQGSQPPRRSKPAVRPHPRSPSFSPQRIAF